MQGQGVDGLAVATAAALLDGEGVIQPFMAYNDLDHTETTPEPTGSPRQLGGSGDTERGEQVGEHAVQLCTDGGDLFEEMPDERKRDFAWLQPAERSGDFEDSPVSIVDRPGRTLRHH